MSEIVKVQVPIVGNKSLCLVYAKGRRNMVEQPVPDAARKALNGDLKGYFKGTWSSVVGWAINERVAAQDW